MFQDFILIHRKAIGDDFQLALPPLTGGKSRPMARPLPGPNGHSWFQFKTCLRNILIGPREDLGFCIQLDQDEIFEGDKAYQFLLEVICGLHSSLLGETEILGQFKNAVLNFDFPDSHFGIELRKFFQAMFEDAKKIRSQYLNDLGSQSYGSILRKDLKRTGETEIHIIGAGHLCEEILPWLAKDGITLHLHVRNIKAGQKKFKNSNLIWHDLSEAQPMAGALIVAAPLGTAELTQILQKSVKEPQDLRQVFDLRHDSSMAPIEKNFGKNFKVKSLREFTNTLDENIELIRARTSSALQAILHMTFLRTETVEHRPFGWEDMTA